MLASTHSRTGTRGRTWTRTWADVLRRNARRFVGDRRAASMMTFALVLPVLMAAASAAARL
jgi:Flp pilus assembly protein TadG